jgi:hypothetical protein
MRRLTSVQEYPVKQALNVCGSALARNFHCSGGLYRSLHPWASSPPVWRRYIPTKSRARSSSAGAAGSSVADEIERYYAAGDGKSVRSFICMPIVVTPPGATPVTIGVLNVQSSRAGLLPGEKAGRFIPLATPFVLLIGRSLAGRALPRYAAPPAR